MKKILFVFALAVLSLIVAPCAEAQTAAPRADTQEWNEVRFIVPLNKKWEASFFASLRIGRNLTHPVDERGGFQIGYKVNKYLTLAPGYLYQASQPTAGRRNYEHRAQFSVTVRVPLINKFTLVDRNLYEYRFRHSRADTSQYRQRVWLERPVKLGKRTWTPFIADEGFYDFRLRDLVRNRFSAGVARRFTKKFGADFYYMRQSDRRARPGDLNVIGTAFRVYL